jgi:hypothetical protein
VWDCDGGRSRGVVLSSQLIGYEELLGCATMSPARLDLWSLMRWKPSLLILAVKPTQWRDDGVRFSRQEAEQLMPALDGRAVDQPPETGPG